MCVVVIKKTNNPRYPVIIAENRDEDNARKWVGWGYHWNNYPGLYGCLDIETKGTWILINSNGVVGIIINREPVGGKHSKTRAYLLFEPLNGSHSAAEAIETIKHQDHSETRPFNLILADGKDVYFFSNMLDNVPQKLDAELIMVNRSVPNDFGQKRILCNYDLFAVASEPDPDCDYYEEWEQLLRKKCFPESPEDEITMCLKAENWETQSSCILSIPRDGGFPIIHNVEL